MTYEHKRMLWPFRLWGRIRIVIDYDSCWNWTGAFHRDGYGKFRMPGPERKTRAAHIVVWESLFGAIPDGKMVLHRCVNNKACCRPSHLYLGTKSDNALDYYAVKQGIPESRGLI